MSIPREKMLPKAADPAAAANEITIKLVNLSPQEKRFLGEVVALFVDPERGADLAALQSANASIYWSQEGAALVKPLFTAH